VNGALSTFAAAQNKLMFFRKETGHRPNIANPGGGRQFMVQVSAAFSRSTKNWPLGCL
jgi:hypothetical protein